MNFVEFTKSGCHKGWITEPGIDLYVLGPKQGSDWYHILKKSSTLDNDDAFRKFLTKHNETYMINIEALT